METTHWTPSGQKGFFHLILPKFNQPVSVVIPQQIRTKFYKLGTLAVILNTAKLEFQN